jgi:hypothetical protein
MQCGWLGFAFLKALHLGSILLTIAMAVTFFCGL